MGILKLGGIASGLDTETLIKQLMTVERRPISLLEQRRDGYITKANAWRDLNSRLLTLQNRVGDLKALSAATWKARSVSVSDSQVLSAQVSAGAETGTYAVNVSQLATFSTVVSSLSSAGTYTDLGLAGDIHLYDGNGADTGKTVTVAATDSLGDIANKINGDKANLGLSASVLQVAPGEFRLVVTGNTGVANDFSLRGPLFDETWTSGRLVSDATAALGFAGTIEVWDSGTNTYTGQSISVVNTDSLDDIALNINTNSAALGFTADVVENTSGQYSLVLSPNAGNSTDFYFAGVAGPDDPVAELSLALSAPAAKTTTASDAALTVNNIAITSAENRVSSAIPGVTLNLLKTGTANVSTAKDTNKLVDAVQSFVDTYNSVVDFMDSLTQYDPKTKATGMLQGESAVLSLRTSLSNRLSDPITGLDPNGLNHLSEVGISTERFVTGASVTGKLTFDKAKFQAALESDPDGVEKLFTLSDGANKGFVVKTLETLESYTRVTGTLLGEATSLERQATDTKARVDRWDNDVAPLKEKRLRDQFIALEKAMSVFQSQGSWLSAQLSGLQQNSTRR